MPSVAFNKFAGSVPRLVDHLIGEGQAALALDCKLWHGALESWREPLHVATPPAGTMTAVRFDCCWLYFDRCVDIAHGPVTCRKFFSTGAEPWPAVHTVDAECALSTRRLGIPCADAAPSVAVGVPSTPKNTEGRSYAYQYVNADGDRGALSKASEAQLIEDGQQVVVSGWEVPDASWGVTKVFIYRSVTTHQSGKEPANTLDTYWMLVGAADIDAVAFVDTRYNDELQEALEEDIATPPPGELQGIVHIDSMNALAGFVGNRLWFSENNSYHHWPYYLDLDDNICGIVESNGLIYVATDGAPYVVAGATDCKNAGCREALRLPVKYPMTGCGNRRIAAVPAGAVYPTHDGLVLLSGRSNASLLTHPLYAPDDWQALNPQSIVPVAHGGKLFVFGAGGSFVVALPGGSEEGWQMDMHSSLSDTNVVDAFVTRNGNFYLLTPKGVAQWDRGVTLRPHKWVSPERVIGTPLGLAAGRLDFRAGSENVKIEADGRTVLDREVLSSRVFRLPRWAVGSRWQVTLTGTGSVRLFSMATSMDDLGA